MDLTNLKPLRDGMSLQTITWTVPMARQALQELEMGMMHRSAILADSMTRDDRVSATLRTRTRALLGLPRSIMPTDETRVAKKIATALETDFDVIAPEQTIAALMRWAVLLGVSVAELIWEQHEFSDGSSRWIPRLKVWHPQFLSYRWDTQSWWLSTQDGQIEIKAGTGQWLILEMGSQRPWMEGLVRELAIPYLIRQFAMRDWARYSEVHGQPTKIAKVPNSSTKDDQELFFKSIRNLGREALVKMVQSTDSSTPGYAFDLLEAKANTWTGFQGLIKQMDSSIAISVLGQNLTTEVSGGSRSAAEVHERKELDIIEADVAVLKNHLEQQLILHWVNINYGDTALSPKLVFKTTPDADAKMISENYSAKAKALSDLQNIGIEITPVLAELGLQRDPDFTNSARFFEYHFKFGIMTKNEVRAALGLTPVTGGDEFVAEVVAPSVPPTSLASKTLEKLMLTNKINLSSSDGFTNGQMYADEIGDELLETGILEPDLITLQKIIANAEDYDDLRAKLLEAYSQMNPDNLRELLQKAVLVADFAGRHAVLEDNT